MRGTRLEALDELQLLGEHRLLALELRLLLLFGQRALLLGCLLVGDGLRDALDVKES